MRSRQAGDEARFASAPEPFSCTVGAPIDVRMACGHGAAATAATSATRERRRQTNLNGRARVDSDRLGWGNWGSWKWFSPAEPQHCSRGIKSGFPIQAGVSLAHMLQQCSSCARVCGQPYIHRRGEPAPQGCTRRSRARAAARGEGWRSPGSAGSRSRAAAPAESRGGSASPRSPAVGGVGRQRRGALRVAVGRLLIGQAWVPRLMIAPGGAPALSSMRRLQPAGYEGLAVRLWRRSSDRDSEDLLQSCTAKPSS
jgi:hypothetical protein